MVLRAESAEQPSERDPRRDGIAVVLLLLCLPVELALWDSPSRWMPVRKAVSMSSTSTAPSEMSVESSMPIMMRVRERM